MKNVTVLSTKCDFNRFTLALKERCETEVAVPVVLRNKSIVEVRYRPEDESNCVSACFHLESHEGYWQPSGHSCTNAVYDIIEFANAPDVIAAPAKRKPRESMGAYAELQLTEEPVVFALVARGFITRYDNRTHWAELLVALPPGVVACDSDAICHYTRAPDGVFYEYYGWEPSTKEEPIYIQAGEVMPTEVTTQELNFRQACRLYGERLIRKYLANLRDGAASGAVAGSQWLNQLALFYVAAVRQVALAEVWDEYDEDFSAVRHNIRKLTDNLSVITGVSAEKPDSTAPAVDALVDPFFERFHVLAMEALPAPRY